MDVDQVEELDEHLVDALLALVDVFVSQFEHLLSRLVDTVAGGPDYESEGDQLTGEREAVRTAIVPVAEAGAVFCGLEDGS